MATNTPHQAVVHFNIPDNLVPQFADVTFVSHTNVDFRLSFYVTIPPVYGTGQVPETIGEGDQRQPVVQAKCVGQIVLTPEQAKGFLEALQANYSSFLEEQKQEG
jgi:hypothetical protein